MVTNYPHPVASPRTIRRTADEAQAAGFGGRVLDRMRQMWCGVRGHDTLLQFERNRLSLRCVTCGHESPGWSLAEQPPRLTVRGDARQIGRAQV